MKMTKVQQKDQERAQMIRQEWMRQQEVMITRERERKKMKMQGSMMRKVRINRVKTYVLLEFQSRLFKNSE